MQRPTLNKKVLNILACSLAICLAAGTHPTYADTNPSTDQTSDTPTATKPAKRVSRTLVSPQPAEETAIEFQRRSIVPQAQSTATKALPLTTPRSVLKPLDSETSNSTPRTVVKPLSSETSNSTPRTVAKPLSSETFNGTPRTVVKPLSSKASNSTPRTVVKPLSSETSNSTPRTALKPLSSDKPSSKTRTVFKPLNAEKFDNTSALNASEVELTPITNTVTKLTSPPESTITTTSLTPAPLNRHDKLLASKAQLYIDKNWNQTTGLIDSVQGYTHATMWDVGSSIGAILALEALELSTLEVTNFRLKKMLKTLYNLPLYKDKLPNRQYNTVTGKPSGRLSKSASNGNGWSALDLGRLYIWLAIIVQHKPHLAADVARITDKWQLDEAVHKGTLYGTKLTSKKEYYRQEGRLGYLQYAATGYRLMGLDVDTAFECERLDETEVDDITIKIDPRNLPFLTLDSFLLYTIEFSHDESCWNQLRELYDLHEEQFNTSKKLTAYAEDSLSKAPWFLYNNIYYQGEPWYSVSHSGKPFANSQTFSNKAAFAMSVIFDSEYSRALANQVTTNSIRHRVIPTGLYRNGKTNTAYNINTNSLILVSLWYKTRNRRPIYEP
ncbi:DUF3131 domain-containing protein [Shewanella youngdeokensis]|uniref:DUF3131 domain-containing protein n=1 Tax=Shewanella youngdeokensis TaxID=2999068 RepID=A0ABZ0JZP4_9GAMM|nr:DUF3131 domain-containing protein [Shewanella sp. DAU334]